MDQINKTNLDCDVDLTMSKGFIKQLSKITYKNGLLVALEMKNQKRMALLDDIESLNDDIEKLKKRLKSKEDLLNETDALIETIKSSIDQC